MPGPQSLSPQPVFPSRPQRRFSLAEANKSLPLVRRIVTDIVATHQSVAQLKSTGESLTGKPQQDAQAELLRQSTKLHDYIEELDNLGVELKDCETGLIDFIGRHEGRDVYLCWRLGESEITHWHELQAGFAGRQPVAQLREEE